MSLPELNEFNRHIRKLNCSSANFERFLIESHLEGGHWFVLRMLQTVWNSCILFLAAFIPLSVDIALL